MNINNYVIMEISNILLGLYSAYFFTYFLFSTFFTKLLVVIIGKIKAAKSSYEVGDVMKLKCAYNGSYIGIVNLKKIEIFAGTKEPAMHHSNVNARNKYN